jgi:hypothetical protein
MQQLNKNNDAQLNKIRDAEIKDAAAYAYAFDLCLHMEQ